MSSFDSLKKVINDLFSWSDPPQQSKKIQTQTQNRNISSISEFVQNKKAQKSQKQTPSTKNDIYSENTNQKKPQELKSTVISYLKNILIEEEVQCLICMNKYRKPGVSKLCMCQHQYCKLCLKEHVNSKLANFSLPKCPQQSCHTQLDKQTAFFKSLHPKTKQLFDKIQKFHFTSNDPFLRMCPSENCQGIIPVIENHPFECVQCQKQFCRKCMYFKHDGKCTKNEAVILNMKYNYCKCNKCGIIVEKTEACDHMTCRCGNEFCYKCGRKWTGVHHCPVLRKGTKLRINNNGNQPQDCTLSRLIIFLCKLIGTILLICFIGLYMMLFLIPMLIGAIIIGFVLGILYYSFYCICEKFQKNQPLMGAALLIFFPLAILLGIYTAFKPQSVCGQGVRFWWDLTRQAFAKPYQAIWQ